MARKKIFIALWEEGHSVSNIKFPVLPETFPTTVQGKGQTIELVDGEERTIFGGAKLDRFTLTSFFPAVYDPSYVTEPEGAYKTPYENINLLRKWCDLERPLRLSSKEGGLNRSVVITNLDYENERAGHLGDIWFTVEFVNYKPPHYRRVAIKQTTGKSGVKTPAKKPTAKNADKLPTTYTVKTADSLGKIALAYYGKADYNKLYNANKKLIDAENKKRKARDKYTIYAGQRLTIPK